MIRTLSFSTCFSSFVPEEVNDLVEEGEAADVAEEEEGMWGWVHILAVSTNWVSFLRVSLK